MILVEGYRGESLTRHFYPGLVFLSRNIVQSIRSTQEDEKMPREKCTCGRGVKHVSASESGPCVEILH